LLAVPVDQGQAWVLWYKADVSTGGRCVFMGSIVICGSGVIGIATALMLARDGHQVTVLESNPEAPPVDPVAAWTDWPRRGVAQFHQPHILLPGFREALRQELPDLLDRLAEAGCVSRSLVDPLPPGITDRSPHPGDERLQNITGRRPVVEAVFAAAADAEPGITVRRGVQVVGLLAGEPPQPNVAHVVGVRTDQGEEVRADLVVDATGRRTPSAYWLVAIGARPPRIEVEDHGFVYYSRFFTGSDLPDFRAPAASPMGSFSLLTIPSDNGTWSLTVYGSSRDRDLKAVRDPQRFTRLVEACPQQAHWLDGTPLTEVLPMAGISDSYRRFVQDDVPVVTGFTAVGDAWACTNPSAGRGLTVGLIQARTLRAAVREWLTDPMALQLGTDQLIEAQVAPFYRSQLAADRARSAEISALRAGLEPPAADPLRNRLILTAGHDGTAFRAMCELIGCLATPKELFSRPGFVAQLDEPGILPALPGPDRDQLLELLAS
jgi:2-polyprenyl-6-methoxyphenol hydroxylase-like FAD-dependent oxidoreductase